MQKPSLPRRLVPFRTIILMSIAFKIVLLYLLLPILPPTLGRVLFFLVFVAVVAQGVIVWKQFRR